MFCAAHSLSMACDSLYVAWLKVHYPYELYTVMLKLYDAKKNKDKIAQIIREMKRYKNIDLKLGQFGQDNRDWLVDREHNSISQSISSIRFMSKQAAEDLYQLSLSDEAVIGQEVIPGKLNAEGKAELKKLKAELVQLDEDYSDFRMLAADYETSRQQIQEKIDTIYEHEEFVELKPQVLTRTAKLDCFVNVFRAMQMNTCLDTRQIALLITLGYFDKFGKTGKLMKVFEACTTGPSKLTKTIKSFMARMETLRQYEASVPDEELPVGERLRSENDNVGFCFSTEDAAPKTMFFVQEVDSKYGIKARLYSICRGTSGTVRLSKQSFEKRPLIAGQCIRLKDGANRPRYTIKGGERVVIPGEKEYWMKEYEVFAS